ncbi:hypothetical protein [Duganella sp.]|uniref:hypothetical protein n=1 Tax=Duganella sp. TaxID=1904440 RepID=UPI0031E0FC89
MRPKSLLDNQSDQPEDHVMGTNTESNAAPLTDLAFTVKLIESNYATKEDLAVLSGETKEALAVINGKIDLLASNQQNFATKADLAKMMYQMTWRMAGFTLVLIGTMVTATRYL